MKKEKVSLKKRLLAAFCAFAICGGGFLASCSDSSDDNDSTDDNQENNQPESSVVTLKSGSTTVYSGTDINAAWAAIGSSGDYVLTLEKGTYSVTEGTQLSYNGAANIKISGNTTTEYGADVIISGNPKTASQKSRELVYLPAGSTGNLTLENVRIVNEYGTTTGDAQAEVLATDGSGNLAAYNCSFISGQDTLRTVAKAWFYKCYIEGDVDFLWMETTGTVALYEECVLHAISSRTTKAYFAAPRAALTSKVGKGLVVYNSKLEADSGLEKLYLARNPWASSALSSYYNNVAFVGTTGDVTLTDLWASDSNGTTDKQYIGFKADSNFTASSTTYGAVLSDSVKTAEYAGRRNILNRVYNVSSAKYQKDSETSWDIDSVISANNWTVTEDTSKDLLDGETEIQSTTYDFSTENSGAYTDSTVTIDGFSYHSSGTAAGVATKTITIPLTGKAVVTVKGCFGGWGTIKAGSQGEGVYNINSGSTSKYLECGYVVYDASATSVVITAATTSYIKSITVEYDDTLSFVPVTGIAVAAASSTFTVGVANTMKATVTPDTASNSAVKWTSSDETVGTIDEFSGEVKFLQAGDVTFTATARDGSGKTGTIACSPEAATWTSAEWYYTKDASSSATASGIGADSSNVAGENVSVFTFTAYSGIALGGTETVSTISGDKTVSMGLKMDGNGKFTFAVTKAATLKLKQAYIKTDSKDYNGYITVTSSDGTATLVSGATSTISADTDYEWTLTAGTYTVARNTGNTSPIIYARVDISE
ncbi:Ig-like domain-containing protein [Treponema saccharophilum]|uniref:Ig domain protein group 2 domain protein n=1 Tax=Treponema saccharophilum DSM 2985 TaxID=907348 RepID=H7EIL6_9SPIR|nr:Ig-like domain-containing protein [Treponema saccharophilum]EIC02544.1 Ig domain protein group 2 domain protein [Treponema saccharophilum DSM 2985]BDC96856.1 hypothetical protein TRSA_19550 [Treponema saccharophilum]